MEQPPPPNTPFSPRASTSSSRPRSAGDVLTSFEASITDSTLGLMNLMRSSNFASKSRSG